MGGLITLALAAIEPDRVAAALLNDVGPVLETAGLDAIKSYIGQGRSFPTWMHAARALEETHGAAFPEYETEQWIAMAKRSLTLCNNGRIAFDYDMKIAEPIIAADEAAVPPDLWPAFDRLAQNPLALLRGELSQLLSPTAFAAMQQRAPGRSRLPFPVSGMRPRSTSPRRAEAIDQLLARVA